MKFIDLQYILILFRAYHVLCLTTTCLGTLDDKHKEHNQTHTVPRRSGIFYAFDQQLCCLWNGDICHIIYIIALFSRFIVRMCCH